MGVTGCAAVVSNATSSFAGNLNQAVLNQTDPETVRDGAPAYLLLIDSLLQGNPDNAALQASAAQLYAAYGVLFAEDKAQAKRLTERARASGATALCVERAATCGLQTRPFEEFSAGLEDLRERDADVVYAFALSWLAYIRAHSDDWVALADLPKVEATLARLQTIAPGYEAANVNLYLGVLNTLRPAALGGKPEIGREYFETAISLSEGRDLSAKVEFARSYARLIYDRELHDQLLTEVVQADPVAPGLTMLNTLAQRDARVLLDSADDYF